MSPIPRLLAVSDRRSLPPRAWSDWCAGLAARGVEGLQVRESGIDDAALFELARAARRAFAAPGWLLMNRRCDIALAIGADAVQLPAEGLPIAAARAAAGRRLLVGCSTHQVHEVVAARDEGADYVVFGPIFDTPSKRGQLAARGLDGLAAAAAVGLPLIAIGGITPASVAAVLAAGATGAAAIRAFLDDESAAAMVAAAGEAQR